MHPLLPRLVALLVLAISAAPLAAITPPPRLLHEGDLIDLRGTLRVERHGWSELLVLHTPALYRPAPNTEAAAQPRSGPTQDIGLTLPGQDDLLAHAAGKTIRVSGRIHLAPASPYAWNGVLLFATTIALPNGDYINPRLPDPGLSLAIHRYTASATLQPRLWPRLYTARDLDTHRPLPTPNLAGCHVSGGGDVLNCFCADGFHPTRGLLHTAAAAQPGAMMGSFVQFPLPAPAAAPITAEVDCTRTTPKE